MHPKEHHDEGVALRLVEGREEVCPTCEQQRSCVIDGVEEVDAGPEDCRRLLCPTRGLHRL